jgi:biotin carboxyl carrier protein
MIVPPRHDEAPDMPVGEKLSIPDRLIVAPAVGVFHRLAGDDALRPGKPIGRGDVLGIIRSLGTSTVVQSSFKGSLVGIVAADGERLRAGQPVAWLTTADGP